MILNGTVEEVVAHLAQVNPHWKRDFGVYSKATKFSKRTYSNWRDAPNYDPPFAWQRACAYQDPTGIDTIDRTSPSKERPGASPGPRRCGRVSCSWSSAIWWCNDVGSTLDFVSATKADAV
jgi:hypothetical protein